MKIINIKYLNKKLLSFLFALGFTFLPITKTHADSSIVVSTQRIETQSISNNDGFYIGYPHGQYRIHSVSPDRIIHKIEEAGIQSFNVPYNNYVNYNVSINGRNVSYRPDSGIFIGRDGNIKCRFYATNTNLDEIDNVITVIGGTGSRNSGEDLDNITLSPNSLIVVCYSGNSDINMVDRANTVADCTMFANFIFLNNQDTLCNSIVGTSEGAQTAFVTVGSNPGVYQTIVCSNGSAYWNRGSKNLLSEHNYNAFRNMEIIFLESKNNTYWNESISRTVNDLLTHDAQKENIYL